MHSFGAAAVSQKPVTNDFITCHWQDAAYTRTHTDCCIDFKTEGCQLFNLL